MLLSDLRSGISPMGDTSTTEDLAKSKQIGGRITGLNEKEYPIFENVGYIEGAVFWELGNEFITNGETADEDETAAEREAREAAELEGVRLGPRVVGIPIPFETVVGTGSFSEIPRAPLALNSLKNTINPDFIFCPGEKPLTDESGSLVVNQLEGDNNFTQVVAPASRTITINIPGAPGRFMARQIDPRPSTGSETIKEVIDLGAVSLEDAEGLEGLFNTKNNNIKAGRWIYGAHFCKYHAIRNKIYPVNQFGGYDLTFVGKTVFKKNTSLPNTVVVPLSVVLAHDGIGLCSSVPGTEGKVLNYYQIPDYSLGGSFGGSNSVSGNVLSPSSSSVGKEVPLGSTNRDFSTPALFDKDGKAFSEEDLLVQSFPELFPQARIDEVFDRVAAPLIETPFGTLRPDEVSQKASTQLDKDPRAGFTISVSDPDSDIIYKTFFEFNFQNLFKKYMAVALGFGASNRGIGMLFDGDGRIKLKFKGCEEEEEKPKGEESGGEGGEGPGGEVSGGGAGDDEGEELPPPPPPEEEEPPLEQPQETLPNVLTVTQTFTGKHITKRTSSSVTLFKVGENSWAGEDDAGVATLSGAPGSWTTSKSAKNQTGQFYKGTKGGNSPIGVYPSFTRSSSNGDMNGLIVG